MMRTIVLADIHFGGEDKTAIATAARAVHAYAPDAVFMAGDLSLHGRRGELEAAADWLQSLGAPVVCTPGNHDTPLWDVVARSRAPFARYASAVADFAADAFVGRTFAARAITTARGVQLRVNWALGSIDLREVSEAAADLERQARGLVRVIVAHHPFLMPEAAPLSGRTRRGAAAARICADAGVDVIVTGHLHTPFLEPLPFGDGLTCAAGCGTLSERLRGVPPSILALESDGRAIAAEALDCSGSDARALWRRTLALRPRLGADAR